MADFEYKKRLILADETVLENCECGYYDKTLMCFLSDISFGDAFRYFSDPGKFGSVIFELEYARTIDRITYSGLEEILSIIQREKTVDVTLTGTNVIITQETIQKELEHSIDGTVQTEAFVMNEEGEERHG